MLVVGPGLGRDPWVQETVTQVCVTAVYSGQGLTPRSESST